jgi:hypothetical protein
MSLSSSSLPLSAPYQTSDFPADYAPQGFQNTTDVIPSSLPSSSNSFSPSSLSCSVSSPVSARGLIPTGYLFPSVREQTANQNEQGTVNNPRSPPSDQHRNISTSSRIVRCSKQQLEEETVTENVPEENSFPDRNLSSSTGSASAVYNGVATQTSDIQYEDEDLKSSYMAKDEQAAICIEGVAGVQQELPRSESVNVRVRKDLNDMAVSPMVQSHDSGSEESTENDYVDMRNEDMSQMSGIIRNALRIQPPPVSVADSDEYITSDRQFSGQDDPSKKESAVKELPETGENCDRSVEMSEESANRFLDLDSSEAVNIIEIDGIRILLPSQFLENPTTLLGNKVPADDPSTSIPLALSISAEEPRESEPERTPVPSLNIQTDETMPPRGELSEQESVGGSDNSVWVQVSCSSFARLFYKVSCFRIVLLNPSDLECAQN